MTPKQFQAYTQRVIQKLELAVPLAEIATANAGKARAIVLSSGTYSTAALRTMGHPYAVQKSLFAKQAQPIPQNPAIINSQSGLFKSSWRVSNTVRFGSDVVTFLYNSDRPVAGWLARGTKKMIPRPFLAAILTTVQPIRKRNLRRAIRTAFSR